MDRLPKKNITAKIIALIMAINLWVYVMNEQNPPVETNMEVPLEVRNLSTSAMASGIPEYVRVKVRGPRTIVIGLTHNDIKSYVDLRGLSDGPNTLKVNTAIPANMELVEVSPEKINFQLDTITSRQIPIEAKVVGTPSEGGAIEKITYSLPNITVKGPSELLNRVNKAVATVDVSNQNKDFTVNVPLTIVDDKDKAVEGLTMAPGNASISVAITPMMSKKIVDVKPNVIGILAKGVVLNQINIKPEKVEISGESAAIAKTDFIYTEPINLTGIEKDIVLEVKLQLKDGIASSKNSVSVALSIGKQGQ